MMYVSVRRLAELSNPLTNPPWIGELDPITREEIEEACKNPTNPEQDYDGYYGESRKEHINRIAWFVVHGWGDSSIHIVLNNNNIYPIFDGCHRVCAAIYRGDETIWANVEGPIEMIKKFFYQDEVLTNQH